MNKKADCPIGIIDSGVGGLTVMKELMDRLPQEEYLYIGDDARCPYGNRPPEEVIEYTCELLNALNAFGVKMAVIACNTATAFALSHVQKRYSFPIIGVIEPGAKTAKEQSKTQKIAVLGTTGTVKSGAYSDAITAISPKAKVIPLACPTFVPVVEQGIYKTEIADETVREALLPLSGQDFDTVILGCTHFPLLAPHIQKHLPTGTRLITSGSATADTVTKLLETGDIKRQANKKPEHHFYTTGNLHHFASIVEDWLEIQAPHTEQIVLQRFTSKY